MNLLNTAENNCITFSQTEFHYAFSPGGGTAVVYNGKIAPGWRNDESSVTFFLSSFPFFSLHFSSGKRLFSPPPHITSGSVSRAIWTQLQCSVMKSDSCKRIDSSGRFVSMTRLTDSFDLPPKIVCRKLVVAFWSVESVNKLFRNNLPNNYRSLRYVARIN